MQIENFKTITLKTLIEFVESELSTLDNKLSNNEILNIKMEFDNSYFFYKSSEDKINDILINLESLEENNREDYNNSKTESDFRFLSNLNLRSLIGFYKYEYNMDLQLTLLYVLEFLQNLKDNYYDNSNDLEISEKTKFLFIAHAINRIKELINVKELLN